MRILSFYYRCVLFNKVEIGTSFGGLLLICFLFQLLYFLLIFHSLAYIVDAHIKVTFLSHDLCRSFLYQVLPELFEIELISVLELLLELLKPLPTSASLSVPTNRPFLRPHFDLFRQFHSLFIVFHILR
jgi:hypothetical protein